jgi:3-hydroxyacyl-[acyl-carrier-protein] dehydratase
MNQQDLLDKLPYSAPFLFVDEILHIDENGVEGSFTFNDNLAFYKGHFKNNPVTPGVILTEVMAQIGVVCLGIFLLNKEFNKNTSIALTSSTIDFLKPVYPKEKVIVKSEKIYFRFGKLKCKVQMINESGVEVCRGEIAGILV